jgi:hypothetical protein
MVHLPDKQVVEASHASRNSNLLQKARAEYFLVVGVRVFPKEQCLSANFRAKLTSVRGVARKFSFRNRRKEKVEFRPGKPGIECGQDTTTTRPRPRRTTTQF